MKKYIQYLIAFILTATVIGVARDNSAWASPQPSDGARPNFEIDVTEDGEYVIGGLCIFRVSYKVAGLSNKAAVDVPAEVSREVTFSYPDDLYLAGCHLTHLKDSLVKNEMSSDEGDWQVCFGDRPNENLTIYYYSDEAAAAGQANWLPLPTTKTDDGFVCAPSMYTGIYAPGGIVIPQTGPLAKSAAPPPPTISKVGTVMVTTASSVRITKPGTYGAGGICELKVDYYVPALANELHVEEDVEISAEVPFPDNQGLLYLPGCHVFHYKTDKLVDEVTSDEGSWEICFAAIPNKETTIYFYYSDTDVERVTSVWTPLKTRVDGGQACAPTTEFTGVYTPVGK
jgi:hypothetical protein